MNTSPIEREIIIEQLQKAVSEVMSVESITFAKNPPDAVAFRGKLLMEADRAFELLRPRFEQMGFTPAFQRAHDQDAVTALPGLVRVKESDARINLILFVLTVVTTFLTGALYGESFNFVNGGLFSASILAILGAHEFGHYFVARYYKAPVTLPYFIPMPPILSPIGTLGAVIRLKAPFANRKTLFDVGIAGPLAGLIVAVPVLFIGLAMSEVGRCPSVCLQEGNSLFYALAKYLVFGRLLPSGGLDVQLSPVAWAGWVGLFVTALNLLPAGQLDGGHVVFALFGKRARYFGWATIFILLVLALPALFGIRIDLSFLGIPGLFYPGYEGWFVWVFLIYLTGVNHPVPLNDLSGIGAGRKILGIITIIIFILLFTPLPFMLTS